MTATVKRPEKFGEWGEVTKALEVVRKDLRRDVKKLEADATAEREQLEKSLRGIVDVLEEGFTTVAKTVRDPHLRKDIGEVAKAIRTALKSAPRTYKAAKPATPKPKATASASARKAAKRPARKAARKAARNA